MDFKFGGFNEITKFNSANYTVCSTCFHQTKSVKLWGLVNGQIKVPSNLSTTRTVCFLAAVLLRLTIVAYFAPSLVVLSHRHGIWCTTRPGGYKRHKALHCFVALISSWWDLTKIQLIGAGWVMHFIHWTQAEVQNIFSDGALSLHTRSLKYGKVATQYICYYTVCICTCAITCDFWYVEFL